MERPRWRWLFVSAGLVGHAVSAQVVRGVVQDSTTSRALRASAVLITSVRDSTLACSVLTRADGRFHCVIPAGMAVAITVRHIGYMPRHFAAAAMDAGDSLDLDVVLAPAGVLLDTVRTEDTTSQGGFLSVTPGRLQFERHMELGKGHFIAGIDAQRSGLRLSDYLVSLFPDSLEFVAVGAGPVVPVANNRFLTSTVKAQCLYARIDRLGIRDALAAGGHADDIDAILAPDDVVGVELYLDYHDVPADWRMDAFPTSLVPLTRTTGARYTVGNIGMGSMAGASRRRLTFGQTGIPTCPFLQIWTRIAW